MIASRAATLGLNISFGITFRCLIRPLHRAQVTTIMAALADATDISSKSDQLDPVARDNGNAIIVNSVSATTDPEGNKPKATVQVATVDSFQASQVQRGIPNGGPFDHLLMHIYWIWNSNSCIDAKPPSKVFSSPGPLKPGL